MAWLRSCIGLVQEKSVTIGFLYNDIYYKLKVSVQHRTANKDNGLTIINLKVQV